MNPFGYNAFTPLSVIVAVLEYEDFKILFSLDKEENDFDLHLKKSKDIYLLCPSIDG